MPIEQTSISILNIKKLVNNLHGQFLTTQWRGKESRQMIQRHVSLLHQDLEYLVQNDIELVPEGIQLSAVQLRTSPIRSPPKGQS